MIAFDKEIPRGAISQHIKQIIQRKSIRSAQTEGSEKDYEEHHFNVNAIALAIM